MLNQLEHYRSKNLHSDQEATTNLKNTYLSISCSSTVISAISFFSPNCSFYHLTEEVLFFSGCFYPVFGIYIDSFEARWTILTDVRGHILYSTLHHRKGNVFFPDILGRLTNRQGADQTFLLTCPPCKSRQTHQRSQKKQPGATLLWQSRH